MHLVSVFLQSLILITGFCGTRPIEHPIPNSAWILIKEEYSCGVSSQWTEISARNRQTGEHSKLASYDEIEEFKITFNGNQVFILGSDSANIKQYRNQLADRHLHFGIAPDAGIR